MGPTSNFGPVIRSLRQRQRWSQERLAELANLNRTYVGEIERGDVVPSLLTAHKLAVALQTPLSVLIARCEHRATACGSGKPAGN
ncbi:helix-turn-helix domain-containing protein [Thauera linaloolentis]|uniref:SgrAlc control protein n=1 Tax=Thauera linaloolentis (strain DSM 12138 / JCM 21573 / CCUG 41526 / CIP 105981 / IAM 15112 / NBRC 102519 / 47Lol) TaxID=1123367 RepID=N6Z6M8_THAL4|nr:helix-turn-helix transcriptional regulator [Thauera linaloolentis]ENO87824.1 SgrAlc control protein [Thauera linaloolentis 47Lol = DSM 12138]MCM8565254.1 helix-turn-helix domain-containing protein [Thauera linaloolentis]